VAFFILKTGGDGWQTGAPPKNIGHRMPDKIASSMILFVCAKINDIYAQGRNFKWTKPDQCPRCGSMRLWGHGFVLAYFDQVDHGLYLRRYRCPDCHCIIRMKVKGYFARFHATIQTIRCCLEHRLSSGQWLPVLSTSRQRHWLSALKRKTTAIFGVAQDLMTAFENLIGKGIIPVSRAI
jgi:hypothetical protein